MAGMSAMHSDLAMSGEISHTTLIKKKKACHPQQFIVHTVENPGAVSFHKHISYSHILYKYTRTDTCTHNEEDN